MTKEIKIAILSSYTAKNIENPLRELLIKNKFKPEIRFGGYNQFVQEMIDNKSWLYSFNPDIILIALSYNTFLKELEFLITEKNFDCLKYINEKFSLIKDSIFNCKLRSSIILTKIDTPNYSPLGLLDLKEEFGINSILKKLNEKIIDISKEDSRVQILDFEKICSYLGKKNFFDEKMNYLGKIILKKESAEEFSKEIVKIINALYGNSKKCIVVDLDNTIWGGIVGEDGPYKIEIGDETPKGAIYSDVQKILLNFKKNGILLAISSKNNIQDVEEAFEKNNKMILKLSDFIVKKINWNPKSISIKEIANELNIGIDSIVFIDDNPAERMEVEKNLPEVSVINLPKDISLYPLTLKEIELFPKLAITEEDKKRHQIYEEEQKRSELKESVSLEDYLNELKIKISVKENDLNSLSRITQLINKTNQFNLRTQRYTEEQVRDMILSKNFKVFSLEVKDKFGELGLTGVIIIKEDEKEYFIDSFLLSCRILSRKIENKFFNEAIKKLTNKNKKLNAEFIKSMKNEQVKNFYESLGFNIDFENLEIKKYSIKLDELKIKDIPWIEVI